MMRAIGAKCIRRPRGSAWKLPEADQRPRRMSRSSLGIPSRLGRIRKIAPLSAKNAIAFPANRVQLQFPEQFGRAVILDKRACLRVVCAVTGSINLPLSISIYADDKR